MDFFEQQERARRKTAWLRVYFFLIVVLLVPTVYLALAPFVVVLGAPLTTGGVEKLDAVTRLFDRPTDFLTWMWRPDIFLGTTLLTLFVIAAGAFWKLRELSEGGSVVASGLGGTSLNVASTEVDDQKLVHVVEEMAIASGLPVPEIYVLEREPGINAFAAGHTPSDMVIGVTRGSLKLLTREELQGVIAHEFSHILNGDTRLNLHLIGLVSGVLCIALIGRALLQVAGGILRGGWRGSGRALAGVLAATAVLAAVGVILIAVGSIGVFFARLLKSAICRQREFLADAAAVQFTRNPEGLAGALKKIGGLRFGSRLRVANAEEASHLFFGNGMGEAIFGSLATHPPLEVRIRALDPTFDGRFPEIVVPGDSAEPNLEKLSAVVAHPRSRPVLRPDQFIAGVGVPGVQHLDHATLLCAALPEEATQAARDPAGAVALVYALLLGPEGETRNGQLKLLEQDADPAVAQEVTKLMPVVAGLGVRDKLPLVDLAMSALRRLGGDQYELFTRNVQGLIESDRQINLFEYTLQKMLLRHLGPCYGNLRKPVIQYYALMPLLPDCAVLLSALAQMGQDEPEAVGTAFRLGAAELNARGGVLNLLDAKDCNLPQIDAALNRLVESTPMIRKNLLYACACAVAADGQVQEREAELLRAIADALDCPVPPFVVGQAASPT
ncbi:MAG: M48 family metallopeptidase [Limisphaerales bacterium]